LTATFTVAQAGQAVIIRASSFTFSTTTITDAVIKTQTANQQMTGNFYLGTDGHYRWKSGTSFYGILSHANTAERTYTFPNLTGEAGVFTSGTTSLAAFAHANSALRTYTFPNTSGTVGLLGLAQTWSAAQTFGAGVTFNSATTHTGTATFNGFSLFENLVFFDNYIQSDVLPSVTNTYQLGNTSFYWWKLWAQNTFISDTSTANRYATNSNCSSSAAPAVCSTAASGSVVIAAAATSVTVNTTAVTANSQIILTRDNSLGTKLSVTCNTQSSLILGAPYVSARTAATSFVITIDAGPTTNPMCISFSIIN
jgi:hypothetical protein